ncbi:hypothetical protein STEG23_032256, partial [Scotinomys teguina]
MAHSLRLYLVPLHGDLFHGRLASSPPPGLVFSFSCLALDSSSSFPCPAFRAIAKSSQNQSINPNDKDSENSKSSCQIDMVTASHLCNPDTAILFHQLFCEYVEISDKQSSWNNLIIQLSVTLEMKTLHLEIQLTTVKAQG